MSLCLCSTATLCITVPAQLWFQRTTHPSPCDSGASDNAPVLAQHAEQEALALDRERFTQTRRSCLEPDRSVGKEPVGEPSLSAGAECLSLHSIMLAHEEKSGNAGPTPAPNKDSAFLSSRERRRASCLGFGEEVVLYFSCLWMQFL